MAPLLVKLAFRLTSLFAMDPQLVSAITQAVIKELSGVASHNSSLIPQIAHEIVRRPVATATMTPSVTRQPVEGATMTPQTDPSLSRSSSSLSSLSRASSDCSSASVTPASGRRKSCSRVLDFAAVEEKVFKPKKQRRKRRSDPEETKIVNTLTRPLMEALDKHYLAPQESPLFRKFFKSKRVNGKRVLRPKKEMDMKIFKRLIRPILRRLLARLCLPVEQQVPVYSKYYKMAIKLVKKRRANHVQSWRLEGGPANLCYDVLAPPYVEGCLATRDETPDRHSSSDTSSTTHEARILDTRERVLARRRAFAERACRRREEESQPQSQLDYRRREEESQAQSQSDDEFDVFDDHDDGESEDDESGDDESDDGDGDRDDGDRDENVDQENHYHQVICVDCKCNIPKGYSFPQSDQQWSTEKPKVHRCKKCWEDFMKNDVAIHVNDEKDRAEFVGAIDGGETESGGGKRKAGDDSTTQTKRRKITKCKWCNSTTHKTRRSKACPYFGTTLSRPPTRPATVSPPAPQPTAVETPAPQPTAVEPAVPEPTTVEPSAPEPTAVEPTAPEPTAVEPTAPEPTAVGPPSAPPQPHRQVYNIGDNVLAMFGRREWFHAHVTGFKQGLYELYFPDDGTERTRVKPAHVKPFPRAPNSLPMYTRADMINRHFYDDGMDEDGKERVIASGMWLVRRLDGNEYVCLRSPDCRNKDAEPNCLNFDVGYVIRQVTKLDQDKRNKF